MIRVQIAPWWWLFDIAMVLGVFYAFEFSLSWPALGAVALTVVFALASTVGPVCVEASQLAGLLQKILSAQSAV